MIYWNQILRMQVLSIIIDINEAQTQFQIGALLIIFRRNIYYERKINPSVCDSPHCSEHK